MFRNELKRYLKSRLNLLILIAAILPWCLSFLETRLGFIGIFSAEALTGFDPAVQAQMLADAKGYNYITYLSNFLASGDFCDFYLLFLLVGFTAVSGTALNRYRLSGYGNFILTRISMGKYLRSVLAAQAAYILTVMWGVFLLFLSVSLIAFPSQSDTVIHSAFSFGGSSQPVLWLDLGRLLLQYGIMTVYVLITMTLTSLLDLVIQNRFVLWGVPLILYFLPLFAINILDSFAPSLAYGLQFLLGNTFLSAVYRACRLAALPAREVVASLLGFPLWSVAATAALFFAYSRQKGRAYL